MIWCLKLAFGAALTLNLSGVGAFYVSGANAGVICRLLVVGGGAVSPMKYECEMDLRPTPGSRRRGSSLRVGLGDEVGKSAL